MSQILITNSEPRARNLAQIIRASRQNTGCFARKYWLDLIYSENLLKKNNNEEEEHEINPSAPRSEARGSSACLPVGSG